MTFEQINLQVLEEFIQDNPNHRNVNKLKEEVTLLHSLPKLTQPDSLEDLIKVHEEMEALKTSITSSLEYCVDLINEFPTD